jgi:hypothetical protein
MVGSDAGHFLFEQKKKAAAGPPRKEALQQF